MISLATATRNARILHTNTRLIPSTSSSRHQRKVARKKRLSRPHRPRIPIRTSSIRDIKTFYPIHNL